MAQVKATITIMLVYSTENNNVAASSVYAINIASYRVVNALDKDEKTFSHYWGAGLFIFEADANWASKRFKELCPDAAELHWENSGWSMWMLQTKWQQVLSEFIADGGELFDGLIPVTSPKDWRIEGEKWENKIYSFRGVEIGLLMRVYPELKDSSKFVFTPHGEEYEWAGTHENYVDVSTYIDRHGVERVKFAYYMGE